MNEQLSITAFGMWVKVMMPVLFGAVAILLVEWNCKREERRIIHDVWGHERVRMRRQLAELDRLQAILMEKEKRKEKQRKKIEAWNAETAAIEAKLKVNFTEYIRRKHEAKRDSPDHTTDSSADLLFCSRTAHPGVVPSGVDRDVWDNGAGAETDDRQDTESVGVDEARMGPSGP